MAERFTDLSHLAQDISEMLNMYREKILGAVADGVQEGAETFVREAKKVSPVKTGEYQRSWKIKPMRRAKYVRYVGNTKKVKAHQSDEEPTIPLINILEFSKVEYPSGKKKARPHVGKAVDNSKDQIFNLMISKIQKESK